MLSALVALGASACTAPSIEDDGWEPTEYVQPVEDAATPPPPPEPAQWSCSYDPTFDRDWHNDVLCSDGTDYDRPHLLENDSFVTESEIMQAAADYERWLNGE